VKAESYITEAHNWIHEQIKGYPAKLGAFAALAMHDLV
jgi:hypothetical protein